MQFSNENEALAAIASLILSADQVGTSPERKYLFETVGTHEPFQDFDGVQFKALVQRVNANLFSTEEEFNNRISSAGVQEFCDAVKTVLPTSKWEGAMQMACELACSDGLLKVEQRLLNEMGMNFGCTPEQIDQMLLRCTAV